MLGPALARVVPLPAQVALWRRQIEDIFHIEEFPYATFRGLGVALCVMGAVEVVFVQPIRDEGAQAAPPRVYHTLRYEKMCPRSEGHQEVTMPPPRI